jgi:hypothetical protein
MVEILDFLLPKTCVEYVTTLQHSYFRCVSSRKTMRRYVISSITPPLRMVGHEMIQSRLEEKSWKEEKMMWTSLRMDLLK